MNRPIKTQAPARPPVPKGNGTYGGKKRSRRKTSPIFILILAVLAVSLTTAAAVLTSNLFCEVYFEYTDTPLPTTVMADSKAILEDVIDESEAPVIINLPEYNFAEVVPENSAVEFSYFDDTVFVGDSRTQGLLLYSKITPYNFAAQGLNVKSIQQKPYIRLPDENGTLQSYTLIEALTHESVSYKSIYIATGLNELGWQCSGFINAFSELIDSIREITDVPIYVQLIIPITTEASESSQYGITNEKCYEFNAALRKLVAEREMFMLDPISLFTLEDGTLNPEYSFDGIHLGVKSCGILAEYYRTHTVDINGYINTLPPEVEADAEQSGA